MWRFVFLTLVLGGMILSCGKTPEPAQPETQAHPTPAPATAAPPDNASSPVIRSDMSPEFLNAFKESAECRGIRLSTSAEKTSADFHVLLTFAKADTPEMEEQWYWTVFDIRQNPKGEFRGAGNQDSPAEAIHDMCAAVRNSFK